MSHFSGFSYTRFAHIAFMLSGAGIGCGSICLGVGVIALVLGFVMSYKLDKTVATKVVLSAGKVYTQKIPEPVPDDPITLVFDHSIDKDVLFEKNQPKIGLLPAYEPLTCTVIRQIGKESFNISPLHFQRSSPADKWRLNDDDSAKFVKLYAEMRKKEQPDPETSLDDDRAAMAYHYSKVLFLVCVLSFAGAYGFRKFT